ncbi:D-lyxose/D-mannose family sugar isomerase [Actibacterium pelagium]|uniref:D-lyxose/D-mannose family sugar isomerase n=1 Tax=Actibacterium pelagium TaxID=2029103 RepID=UPI0027E40E33|nr:D-lyxose/D-mannose family sugar isomerase [Actibacterium pelagium]
MGNTSDVQIGEALIVNDGETDNILQEPVGLFPDIEEDKVPTHLLVRDQVYWFTARRPERLKIHDQT